MDDTQNCIEIINVSWCCSKAVYIINVNDHSCTESFSYDQRNKVAVQLFTYWVYMIKY